MPGILDLISQRLTPDTISQISRGIGASPQQTQQAISAALPLLLGGLSRNANRTPEGADQLTSALDRDHDGGLLDQLGSLVGSGGAGGGLLGALGGMLGGGGASSRSTNGAGILEHILGGRRGDVETGIGKATGLDRNQTTRLLVMLAPIVMAALGRMRRERNLNSRQVAEELKQEEERIEAETPGVERGSLLSILDANKDGSIADEVARIGSALGGALLISKMTKRS